jgi:uncharacterized protein YkwD
MLTMKPILFIYSVIVFICFSYNGKAQKNFKADILREVNKVRAEGCRCGQDDMPPVAALSWDSKLEKTAGIHADDMLKHNFFGHKGSDHSMLDKRLVKTGYTWSAIGENLAKGYKTVDEVVEGWINSPGHCAILMDAEFTEAGAVYKSPYWVMVFAAPLQKR